VSFSLAAGAAALTGLLQGSWRDRLREAAYTSPSGTRIRFEYEEVSREWDKRGTVFDYPGVSESYVQQMGHSSRRYPLACFFFGATHDLEASALEAALLEDGIGQLEHPVHGRIPVVPFGTVTRRDDPAKTANQTIVEVTFWTTLGAVYPSAGSNAQNEILSALDGFDVAMAQQFADSVDFAGEAKRLGGIATVRKFLKDVGASIGAVSDVVSSVRSEYDEVLNTIHLGIDVLIGQPLLLAQQVGDLIKAPARSLAGIESRLEGYRQLAESVFSSPQGSPTGSLQGAVGLTRGGRRELNDFATSNLFAMQAVAGSVASVSAAQLDGSGNAVATPQFSSRTQAIAAAEAIAAQRDQLVAWRDAGFAAIAAAGAGNSQRDTGGAYQALQRAAALAQGYLVQLSFTLLAEKTITLDRDLTLLQVAGQLYGTVDGRLDDLIAWNDLTGEEILELPKGKLLRYYPTA